MLFFNLQNNSKLFSHELKKKLANLTNSILALKSMQGTSYYQTKDFIEKELLSVRRVIQEYSTLLKFIFLLIFQRNEQQIDSGTHAACLPQKMRPIGSKTKQKIRNEFQAGQFKPKGKNHGQTFKLRPSLFKRQDTGQALILLKVP